MPTLADLAAAVQRLRASADAALGSPTLALRQLDDTTVEYSARMPDGRVIQWDEALTPAVQQIFDDFATHTQQP